MQAKREVNDGEIDALRGCVNDLVAIISLPAIWAGEAAPQIIAKLLEVIQRMQQLDFAYACLPEVPGREALEVAKFAFGEDSPNRTMELGNTLRPCFPTKTNSHTSANTVAHRGLNVAIFQLGLRDDAGWFVVGSQRTDFPTKMENMLLGVAANHATLDIEKAHVLQQQQQLAAELDRIVAQRTEELQTTNAALRDEIVERELAEKNLETLNKVLAESRNDLHLAIDSIPGLVWTSRPDGNVEFHNQRWLQYTGFTQEEARGWGWRDAIHPDDLPGLVAQWRMLLAEGKAGEHEARLRRFDGGYRWFLFRGVPLRDGTGNISRWYGLNSDIDDFKRAETILAGEKKLFEMVATGHSLPAILEILCQIVERLAEGSMLSILLLDEDGLHLRHYAAPSLPEDYVRKIDGVPTGPSEGSCGTAAYSGKSVYVSDIASDSRWSNYRDLALEYGLRACFSTPIRSGNGNVLGTFAIYATEPREISGDELLITEQFSYLAGQVIERKRGLDALKQSEAFLAQGQRIGQMGTWAWNIPTDKVVWSEEHSRIFGYRLDEAGGTFATILGRMSPAEREKVGGVVYLAVKNGEDFNLEYSITTPDGSVKYCNTTGRALAGEPGKIADYVGITMDITDRIEMEGDLRKLQGELAHVTRVTTLGELAASIAHEVNQPLTGIVTNSEASLRWLDRDMPNLDEARKGMSRVIRDGKRASEVIARIRQLFRKDEPVKECLDLNDLVQDVVTLAKHELEKGKIAFHFDPATGLPQVFGDRVQIQQVLMNLILNAIEAMNSVESQARNLWIRTFPVENDRVGVEVRDDGPGIDPSRAEQIFDPFHTSKPSGMGMGLSICRSIIENHGSKLQLTATDGPGAAFQFTLAKATLSGDLHE